MAPPIKFLGKRIVIHAAKTRPRLELVRSVLPSAMLDRDFPTGVALGTAVLEDFHEMPSADPRHDARDDLDAALGIWTPGRFAWYFVDHELFEKPIPMSGGQRVWYCEI